MKLQPYNTQIKPYTLQVCLMQLAIHTPAHHNVDVASGRPDAGLPALPHSGGVPQEHG